MPWCARRRFSSMTACSVDGAMNGRRKRGRAGFSGAPRTRCQYCHVYFEASQLTVDHIVPRAMGGDDRRRNLAAACKACNDEKAARDPREYWRAKWPTDDVVPAWIEAAVEIFNLPPLLTFEDDPERYAG